jgi:RimJ/RimL family protein N-acetyltransferase
VGPDRPGEEIVAGSVVLRRHRRSDCVPLVIAVNQSLAHLAPWMVWAQEPASEASIGAFLDESMRTFDAGSDFGYAIVDPARDLIVGGAGLHRRLGPGAIEIGYWVHVGHTRRGIATAVAVALRDEARSIGIDRVELHCDEGNVASAGVARRAGFELLGTEPRAPRAPGESGTEMIWRARAEIA